MKTKLVLKLASLLLAAMLCFVSFSAAFADEETVFGDAGYFTVVTNNYHGTRTLIDSDWVTISSGSAAHVSINAHITAVTAMQTIGIKSIKLLMYLNGSWQPIWESNDNYSYNTSSYSYGVSISCYSNRYFKATCKFYVKNHAGVIETDIVTTSPIISQ